MPKGMCAVEGCERTAIARSLCKAHYERARRTGEPGAATVATPNNPRTRPLCTVEGCSELHKTNGYCALHYQRWRKWGDPLTVGYLTGGAHQNWKGDDITYIGAHHRVERARGAAVDHRCVHCDALAVDWAYDHLDPNELRCEARGYPYSADPMHYMPLCQSCHNTFDRLERPMS